jgi:proline iminopeptidase
MTRSLYPPIEPYRTHRFEVSGGHNLYVEEVGDPHGVPAVFLHGGPGGGIVPAARRFFGRARLNGTFGPVAGAPPSPTWCGRVMTVG